MLPRRISIGAALILLFFLALRPAQVQALPAFPGAQGWGANALGGRGGAVIQVTNLSDSGAGSLRACVAARDPRTCVFTKGGTITLNTRLDIKNPFLTIAGQTAPGGGIQIKGHAILVLNTHNVIIRYIRHRRLGGGADGKGIQIGGAPAAGPGSKDIIIDHSSFAWQGDDNDVWGGNGGITERITLQWCIFAESSRGFISGVEPPYGARVGTLSLHHNYWASNAMRNPQIGGNGPTELVNNVMYNHTSFATVLVNGGTVGVKMNIVGNFWKRGPESNARYEFLVSEGATYPNGKTIEDQPPDFLYVLDNLGPRRPLGTDPQFAFVGFYGSGVTAAPANLRRLSPWPGPANPITVSGASANVAKVLNNVGAILPSRDSVDSRLVNEYSTGRGSWNGPLIGQYPVLAAGTPPADTDRDGMSDAWENSHGLNPNNAADRNGIDASGYTELEVYLNNLAGGPPPPPEDPPESPVVNVTAPANGSTVSGSAVAVSATATDDVAVLGVQFKLDGNNLGAEDTSSPYSISWNSTLASEGAHTIKAVARDASSSTTSASIGVTVDNVVSSGPDPVSHYKFDETSGTTAFDFINAQSNDLSLQGGASFAAGGQLGRAISLDGINGHAVDASTTGLNLASAITITAWLKPTTLPAQDFSTIVMKGSSAVRGYGLDIFDGKLSFARLGGVAYEARSRFRLALSTTSPSPGISQPNRPSSISMEL